MLSIFTSTYNRAQLLKRLYFSLLRQTSYDFEWIVVDDDSSDGTEDIVNEWINNNPPFLITYLKQKRGGKCRASNKAAKIACYDAFLAVDSDDYLLDDAVETINKLWIQVSADDSFAGISGHRIHEDGNIVGGSPTFEGYIDATNFEREKYHIQGDKSEVYKTKLIRQYPYPEFDGEIFMTEGCVFDHIAFDGYKIRWFDKPFVVCEYLPDGITNNIDIILPQNYKGWAYLICECEKYRGDLKTTFKWKYEFFERMHQRIPKEEICKLLYINDALYGLFEYIYLECIKKIEQLIIDNAVMIIAVYGYGKYARRLEIYLKELQLQIDYAIDRRTQYIRFDPVYSLDMNLPTADIVFITMQNVPDNLLKKISSKLPKAKIVTMQQIDSRVW